VVKAILRLTITTAALVTGVSFDVSPGFAFGDGLWCASINKGPGEVYLDCQYRTFEECRAGAAADRGFCNLNPAPGRQPRSQFRRSQHY
jgi:Protein of unknown function (DUF3551)